MRSGSTGPAAGQAVEHRLIVRAMAQAGPFQPAAHRFQARVHRSAVSVTSRGDQKRSAMAAMRGQMRESTVSGAHVLGPHAGLAAENARRLIGIQRARRSVQRIDRIVDARPASDDPGSSRRENAAIALPRGVGQRLLPAPGLNHGIARQAGRQHFVPADHDLAVLLQQCLHALIEVRVQLAGCSPGGAARANAWMAADCFHCASSTSSPPMWK